MPTRLSVILPVYNGMPYLPEAVESILTQTYTDFTLIIVNDGSTDGTGDYLRTISDPRVVVIKQKNAGQGAARKVALSRCQSEYVALMDADDVSLPNRLAIQVAFLDNHSDTVMIGTQFDFLVGDKIQKALRAPKNDTEIRARLMEGRAGLCNPSLMFRRQNALACGEYPVGIFGEDIDFCLQMCEQGIVANIDRVLVQYRMHALQTCLSKTWDVVSAAHYAAYRAHCRRLGQTLPTFDEFLLHASWRDRLKWDREAKRMAQYRTGYLQVASGHLIRGYLRLIALVLSRPHDAILRVMQIARASLAD